MDVAFIDPDDLVAASDNYGVYVQWSSDTDHDGWGEGIVAQLSLDTDSTNSDDYTVTPLRATVENMCKEVWNLAAPDAACARIEGTFKRDFDTGDYGIEADLLIDYNQYTIAIQFGPDADGDPRDTEEVDFGYFKEPEDDGALSLVGSAISLVAALAYLSF